jgi:cytidyltransferase-like protein
MAAPVVVSGSFDQLHAPLVRFLEEAARLGGAGGSLRVLLWSDALVQRLLGQAPRFPAAERLYVLSALRWVSEVELVETLDGGDALPEGQYPAGATWAVPAQEDTPAKRAFCQARGLVCRAIPSALLNTLPPLPVEIAPELPGEPGQSDATAKKVIVTGCYDWLHSGHVRFFEEVSQLGTLYVAVGSDANVRLLKGEGHPMFSQDERAYLVGAIRFVRAALITTGSGWMDAAPEIERLRPDIYAVNEDGDKPEKRAFCAEHGLEYAVLQRLPKSGLARRTSTNLRGF